MAGASIFPGSHSEYGNMETIRAGVYFERDPVHHVHNPDGVETYHTQSANNHDTRQYLPYVETTANVTVINTTSHTVMTQTFINNTDRVIERVAYCFPLYHFSVITAFRYWHGADLVEGILKPKQTGRHEFEKAIRQETVGSLLEQHTSEVFETAIGNIQPNHDVKIEIHYVTELKADLSGHGLVLTIPSSVAPRYGTPPASISSSLNSSTRTHIDGGIKIEVNVSMPVSVRSLKCRAHPVEVEMGYNDLTTSTSFFRDLNRPPAALKYDATKAKARSTIQETALKADYVLVIITAPSEHSDIPGLLAPRALMEAALPVRGLTALQVAFAPRDLFPLRDEPPRTNSEIVLLVDLSGSMVPKMESLQRALALFLRNLHADSLFNICVFGTNFESMWNQSKPINQQNSAEAQGYISQLKANKGRTNLRNALQKAANKTRQHFATQVVVFTDGELWDVEGVHNYVRQAKDTYGDALRFFALGIGDNVSHELVEGIGKFGGGFAEVVPVDSSEQWNDRIERMLNGVRTCSDWKINLKLKDTDGNLHSRSGFSMQKNKDMGNSGRFIQAPHYLPVVHGFSRTSVYLLIDAYPAHYTALKVEAIANDGQEFSTEIEFEHVSADKPVFHQFAARALLYDIEMGYSWLHDRELIFSKRALGSTASQHIDEEAEHIAMLWNLVSKWTTFVGIHGVDQSPRQSTMHRYGPSRRNQNQRELKELMKPRKGGPVFHSGRHKSKDKDDGPPPPGGGGSAGGTAGGSTGTSSGGATGGRGTTSTGGSNGGGTEHSSNYGSSRAAGDTHDSAVQTASIEQLAALQDQDGAFPSVEAESNERLNVFEIVLRCFNPDVLEMLEGHISGVNATESQRSRIYRTFICIVYLKRIVPPSIQKTRVLERAEVFLSRSIKKRSQRNSIENDVGRSWMMGGGALVSLMNAAQITSESSVMSADAMDDMTYTGEPDSSFSQDAIDSDMYVSSEVPSDTQFWRPVPGSTSLQESDHDEEVTLRTHKLVEEISQTQQHRPTQLAPQPDSISSTAQIAQVGRVHDSATSDRREGRTHAAPLTHSSDPSSVYKPYERASQPRQDSHTSSVSQRRPSAYSYPTQSSNNLYGITPQQAQAAPTTHPSDPYSSYDPYERASQRRQDSYTSPVSQSRSSAYSYLSQLSNNPYTTTPSQRAQAAPPTHPSDPYSAYDPYERASQRRQDSYTSPASRGYVSRPSAYSYPPQSSDDPYGRTPQQAQAAPGYYIDSDGRQYPLSQRPQNRGPDVPQQ